MSAMKKTMFRVMFASAFLLLVAIGTLPDVDFGVADAVADDEWKMLQHDVTHSGYSSSNAPYTNVTLWNYTTHSSYSSPVLANGCVFIASINGYIYCLNALTGTLVWSVYMNKTNIMQAVVPTVVDGKLYIGAGESVYCLNASQGSQIWKYTTGAGITQSSPAVISGRVYIGSIDKNMYCLDAVTGSLIWNFTTGSFVIASPIVANDIVYFGSHDYNFYALNASSGEMIWIRNAGFIVDSSPTFSEGKIYFGTKDGSFICLDASKGTFVWIHVAGSSITGAPAVVDGKVYFGSWDHKLYCLDAKTGEAIWTYTTGDTIAGASPAVANGKVYIGSYDHKIYCLNANEGWVIWSYDTQTYVGTSPAIANGIVYANSFDVLYAFVGSPGSPEPTPKTNPTTAATNSPSQENTPKQTPTPKPQSQPSTIQVATNTGALLNFTIKGNITGSQISSAVITTNQSAKTTQLSFNLTGQSGTIGFSNITIPKNAASYGNSLAVFIDGQPAEQQGYAQDAVNYYVWYTTHFSSHQLSIIFSTDSANTTVSPEVPWAQGFSLTQIIGGAAVGIVIVGIITALLVVVIRRGEKTQTKRTDKEE
ncbi:MAG: PQQ-binding-like beta-propeller repeat protein [Candidatus Bathyarchaeota archaeon]|nr:PQQ-binding-like beta-propeller repeat protein [Candidatus Bathyarchaeota archaeon]